jgi:hypothetical protein
VSSIAERKQLLHAKIRRFSFLAVALNTFRHGAQLALYEDALHFDLPTTGTLEFLGCRAATCVFANIRHDKLLSRPLLTACVALSVRLQAPLNHRKRLYRGRYVMPDFFTTKTLPFHGNAVKVDRTEDTVYGKKDQDLSEKKESLIPLTVFPV